jgi:Tfp pilus assembly protein PilZ
MDYTAEGQAYKVFILNISRGGALISTGKQFLLREKVELAFRHPDTEEDHKITGEIVWEGPQGIGVKSSQRKALLVISAHLNGPYFIATTR